MAPPKARGPNGMPLNFFFNQSSVLHCLNSTTLPQPLKHTFVTLILKVKNKKIKNPELVYEFRPISLYNVLYKIFLKVLTFFLGWYARFIEGKSKITTEQLHRRRKTCLHPNNIFKIGGQLPTSKEPKSLF